MFIKECNHGPVKVEPVFLVSETVAFIVFHHVFYINATIFQCLCYLVRFGYVDSLVISSLGYKKRGMYLKGNMRIAIDGISLFSI